MYIHTHIYVYIRTYMCICTHPVDIFLAQMKLLVATAHGPLQQKWGCYVVKGTRSANLSRKLKNVGSPHTLANMEQAKIKSTCLNSLPREVCLVPTQVRASEGSRQRAWHDFFVCAAFLLHVCVRHVFYMCVCGMTFSCVRHVIYMCVCGMSRVG